MSLIAELKRRNVFRVGAAYAIVAWLLVEVASVVLPTFEAPEWVMKAFTFLVILGFPLALILAWAFELTPEGIKRESAIDPAESITHPSGRKLDFAIIGLLVIAVVYFAVDKFVLEAGSGQLKQATEQISGGVSVAREASIAVLAFADLSPGHDQEYFSDGMAEEILNSLAQVPELKVAGRTSSFYFKGKDETLQAIGTALGVAHVLEGSVRKQGDQVRITVQLIRADNGFHLWSQSYDGELKDVFELQERIAREITGSLKVVLAGGEEMRLAPKTTQNAEAHQLYLKGRHATTTLNDWDSAIRYLQQAVARDPSYAQPYVGLAEYYIWSFDWILSPLEACPRAREAAEKALQLDASLAEPHVWLAMARWWCRYDPEGARREFETALVLQPDLISAHEWYGYYLVANGEIEQGLTESRRAVELDPLSAHTSILLGINLFFAGHDDAATQSLRTALTIDPDSWWAREWLGRVYAREGRFPEAIAELLAAQKVNSSPEIASVLGRIYADAGDRPAATRVLNELRQRMRDEFIAPAYIATILVGLGEIDQAFVALGQAYEQHSWYVTWWKVDPDLDPLRADPRFAALLQKVGQTP